MPAKHPITRLDTLRIRHFELIQKLAELGSLRRLRPRRGLRLLPPSGAASRSRQALEGEFLRVGRSPPLPAVAVTSFVYALALVARTSMLTVAPATAVRAHEKAGGVKRLATSQTTNG